MIWFFSRANSSDLTDSGRSTAVVADPHLLHIHLAGRTFFSDLIRSRCFSNSGKSPITSSHVMEGRHMARRVSIISGNQARRASPAGIDPISRIAIVSKTVQAGPSCQRQTHRIDCDHEPYCVVPPDFPPGASRYPICLGQETCAKAHPCRDPSSPRRPAPAPASDSPAPSRQRWPRLSKRR